LRPRFFAFVAAGRKGGAMADESTDARAISRRDLLKTGALGLGAVVLGPAGVARAGRMTINEEAAAANTIKVGFVSPRTGPLGGFGEPDPFAIGLTGKALANGLTRCGKKYSVRLTDKDTQSYPAPAGRIPKAVIN